MIWNDQAPALSASDRLEPTASQLQFWGWSLVGGLVAGFEGFVRWPRTTHHAFSPQQGSKSFQSNQAIWFVERNQWRNQCRNYWTKYFQSPGFVQLHLSYLQIQWFKSFVVSNKQVKWRCAGWITLKLRESRRRRTKGSVVGEEWCQNAAPLRWYTKNVFAQSKMILSRAWLHDTVSCAAWNDARKGVYLKPLFRTPCSNCYWGWNIPIMLDYGDISRMESVPLMWGPVTGNWTHDHFRGGRAPAPLKIDIQYITARIPWIPRAGPPIPPKLVLKHGELR